MTRTQPKRGAGRRLVLMLVTLLLSCGITLGAAQAASADPKDCKPSNVPQVAGTGVSGLIDDKPEGNAGDTKYGQYGWAGLKWTKCDLAHNAVGVPQDEAIDGTIDTGTGNALLGAAVVLGATMTQMHEWAANPKSLLEPIDKLLVQVTKAVGDATWYPYVAAFIIAAACGVVLNAMRGEMRRSLKTVAAIALACFAMAWITTPYKGEPGALHAAQLFDGVAAKITGDVDANVAQQKGDKAAEKSDARGATFQDNLLFSVWARGELGTQAAAARWGDGVYSIAAVKYSDAATVKPSERRDAFAAKAKEIQKADPAAYDAMRGASGNRSGYGALALIMMLAVAVIRIPAEILLIGGVLVIRLLVMFAPVLALTAVLESTRPVAVASLKIVLASVMNVAVYGVIAAIHTALTGVIAAKADNLAAATVLLVLLTILLWLISKPFRSFTRPATGQAAADAMTGVEDAPGKAMNRILGLLGSSAGSYIGSRAGSRQGVKDADEDDDNGPSERIEDDRQQEPPPSPKPPPPPPDPAPVLSISAGALSGSDEGRARPELERGPGGPDRPGVASGPPPLKPIDGGQTKSAELPAGSEGRSAELPLTGPAVAPTPVQVAPAEVELPSGPTAPAAAPAPAEVRRVVSVDPDAAGGYWRPNDDDGVVVVPGEVVSVHDVIELQGGASPEPEMGADGRLTDEPWRPDDRELVEV